MDYKMTEWKDQLVDKNKNVIQQGTPVSAKNLNNIERGIANLDVKIEAAAELVRESIPSGFTTLGEIDYEYMTINPNTIKMKTESVAYVNGYKTVIPAGTVIQLNIPPSTGKREDLVFLECWKEANDKGVVSWKNRIRVVDDVDFKSHANGLRITGELWDPLQCFAQGGASQPLDYNLYKVFCSASGHSGDMKVYGGFDKIDNGLFIAGEGNENSRNIFKSADGYVYAIPMFRVWRRNSGCYSVRNGNGSTTADFTKPLATTTSPSAVFGGGSMINVCVKVDDTSKLVVGKKYAFDVNAVPIKINKIIDSTTIEIANYLYIPANTGIYVTGKSIFEFTDRFDNLYANIIYDRDIIDLRHQVSLTGFNYQQLLEENFDKLLRGELKTKEKTRMLKTYHGIKKTPIDANTVFYVSFDGTTVTEVNNIGTNFDIKNLTFRPTTTGLGMVCTQFLIEINRDVIPHTSDLTIDFTMIPSTTNGVVYQLGYSDSTFFRTYSAFNGEHNASKLKIGKPNHIRVSVKNGVVIYFVNGAKIASYKADYTRSNFTDTTKNLMLRIGGDANASSFMMDSFIINDLSISNIDRGDNFPTLPQDFIDGYADIQPAFNSQRKVFSDALTSQYTVDNVKASGVNPKQIIVTQKNTGTWTVGDTIKVRGLGGEIITGVGGNNISPIVKSAIGAITGNWSGLGTSEATFTLDTNEKLANQDIQIEYSLNMMAGQGGISEVFTEVLGGEYDGKKLVVNPNAYITDDFKDKVSNSIVECPHKAYAMSNTSLYNPKDVNNEFRTEQYSMITNLDGICRSTTTSVDKENPHQIFSFNIIEMIERKFGKINAIDKAQWCKDNIDVVYYAWFGYGSSPSGNKAYFYPYRVNEFHWESRWISSSTSNTVNSISFSLENRECGLHLPNFIDDKGFIHCIAYTDPSNGKTPSIINTDKISISVKLKTPIGYDILTVENPRAREDKSNLLLIRKETREIQAMFNAKNDDGIVTYGDYVPSQTSDSSGIVKGIPLTKLKGCIYGVSTQGVCSKNNENLYVKDFQPEHIDYLPDGLLGFVETVYGNYNKANYIFRDVIEQGLEVKPKWIVNEGIFPATNNQVYSTIYFDLNSEEISKLTGKKLNYIVFALIKYGSEIYLIVFNQLNTINFSSTFSPILFKINGRPLIK